MSYSRDYISSSDSDDSDDLKYTQPKFVKKSKRSQPIEQLKPLNSSKTSKARHKPKPTCLGNIHLSPSPIIENDADDGKRQPKPEYETVPKKPSIENEEPTFEFGEPLNGYRFVGNWREYEEFLKSRMPENDEVEPDDPLSVNPLSFDRCNPSSKRSKDIGAILSYWNKESNFIQVPMQSMPILDSVSFEEINKGDIQQFFLKSSAVMNVHLKELYKQQRVYWHPDKMVRLIEVKDDQTLPKITKIFQIINDLWEAAAE